MNSSQLCQDSKGLNQAIELLFRGMMDFSVAGAAASKLDIEYVKFEQVVDLVSGKIIAILNDDDQADTDSEALLNQIHEVLDCLVEKSNRLKDAKDDAIEQKLKDILQRLLSDAIEILKRDPQRVDDLIARIEEAVVQFKPTGSSVDHGNRLANAGRTIRELNVVRDRPIVADEIRRKLRGEITSDAKTLIPLAVRQSVGSSILQAWENNVESHIKPGIEQLRKLSSRTIRSRNEVQEQITDHHRQLAEQSIDSPGIIKLESPDDQQVIEMVMKCFGGSRIYQQNMLREFHSDIASAADEEYPLALAADGMNTPLSVLIAELPSSFVMNQFREFITSKISGGVSIYKLIENHLPDVLKTAYEKAAPLINLQGRNISQLNIEVTENLIVAFPKPYNSHDAQILATAKAIIRDLDKSACFTQAPEGHNKIIVTRMVAGFPASCMAHLMDQKDSYVRAAKNGHLMHLPLLVSDDGCALQMKS